MRTIKCLGLGLVVGLYWLYSQRFYVGFWGDDSRDIVAALSLLQGHYVNLLLPHQPPTNFPLPGFPLLLVPFVALFQAWQSFVWLPIGLTAITLVLFERFLRSLFDTPLRWAIVLAMALNASTVALAGRVIADALFVFQIILAFYWMASDPLKTSTKSLRPVGVAWIVGWALITRPEGFALYAACAWFYRTHRDRRAFYGVLLIPLVVWGGVMLRNWITTGHMSGYTAIFSASAFYSGWFLRHVLDLIRMIGADVLLGISRGGGPIYHFVSFFLCGMLLALWVCGMRNLVRRFGPKLVGSMIVFVGVHTAFHIVWTALDPHYFWPLLPFLLIGIAAAVGRWETLLQQFKTVAVGGLFAMTTLWQLSLTWPEAVRRVGQDQIPIETSEWVKGNIPLWGWILSANPTTVYLLMDRFSSGFFPAKDPATLISTLQQLGFSHVLVSPHQVLYVHATNEDNPAYFWQRMEEWTITHPDAFRLVYENRKENTRVYAVQRSVNAAARS